MRKRPMSPGGPAARRSAPALKSSGFAVDCLYIVSYTYSVTLEFADEIAIRIKLWVVRAEKVEAENAERGSLRDSACAIGVGRLDAHKD